MLRLTLRLPWELDHVHAYLLRADDGWVVVDTGLGTPGNLALWEEALEALASPVVRIVVTHFHPDHIGCATALAERTGAPVLEGARDHELAVQVWGGEERSAALSGWYRRHGVPGELCDGLLAEIATLRSLVRWPRAPEVLSAGDRIEAAGEEWEVHHMPGHADGLLVLLGTRTGRLLASDHLLAPITPNIGLHLEGWPDPLGCYLESLGRTIRLGASAAFTGHRDPIADPAGRATELLAHHERRLDATEACLAPAARSAYELSLELFGTALSPHGRRFAVAETLAHLARLELEGRTVREEGAGLTTWRRVSR
jgi:glyoxylase-like metal-dependent hydrolase (beta-lactamase superfamily II)